MAADVAARTVHVARLGDDLNALLAVEQQSQAAADNLVVVRKDDADGPDLIHATLSLGLCHCIDASAWRDRARAGRRSRLRAPPRGVSPFPQYDDTFTRWAQTVSSHSVSEMPAVHPNLSAVEDVDVTERAQRAPLTVVIADDHALMRHSLGRLLQKASDITVVAGEPADLKATARLVAECRPDVLVLDLCMPDGSSLKMTSELRTRMPEMQIVIVSMEDAPGFAQRALAAGAIGYVVKEFADEDLAPAIRAAARGDEYLSARVAGRLTSLRQTLTHGRLTPRESEVLRLIALGHTNVEIARKLTVSARTIETHRANIHRKLGLRTRAELVRYALLCGLLES